LSVRPQNHAEACSSGLKPKTKSVITLYYAHGLTMRKIASLLKMSEWQVQESRRQAIGELRTKLAPLVSQVFPEPARLGS